MHEVVDPSYETTKVESRLVTMPVHLSNHKHKITTFGKFIGKQSMQGHLCGLKKRMSEISENTLILAIGGAFEA